MCSRSDSCSGDLSLEGSVQQMTSNRLDHHIHTLLFPHLFVYFQYTLVIFYFKIKNKNTYVSTGSYIIYLVNVLVIIFWLFSYVCFVNLLNDKHCKQSAVWAKTKINIKQALNIFLIAWFYFPLPSLPIDIYIIASLSYPHWTVSRRTWLWIAYGCPRGLMAKTLAS